jgi:hypothetical protein
MVFKYLTGEEAKAGDRIKYHSELGEVEFVAMNPADHPDADWYIQQYPPGGIMIVAQGFGHVFITAGEEEGDLEFVARKN